MDNNDTGPLEAMILPLLNLNIKKQFSLKQIDKLLLARPVAEEKGEKIQDKQEMVEYIYEDEVEEQRISDNYRGLIRMLIEKLYKCQPGEGFDLREFNGRLAGRFGSSIYKNADYYSMLVHMCQKKSYYIDEVVSNTDTFFEAELKEVASDMTDLGFSLTFDDDDKVTLMDMFEVSNIYFTRL